MCRAVSLTKRGPGAYRRPMTDVSIRPVAPADFEPWLVLWDGYNAFYGRNGATKLDRAITDITWARFFATGEPVHALVAEADGQLLGLAHYLFHRSTTMINNTCYLQDLFTAPEARGRGVGRALIAAAAEAARAGGSSRLYWLTQENNATARKLYDAVAKNSGFIVYRMAL